MGGETVRVLVRCRPMNKREEGLKCKAIVETDASIGQVRLRKPAGAAGGGAAPKAFTFDGAYGTDSNSQVIYEELGFPLVENVLGGYNGTVFAYGQTGAGKSFTMEGIPSPAEHQGITPRSFRHIFQAVAANEGSRFLVQASYLEIYNEQIRDLLADGATTGLDLKEHPDKGIFVKGLQSRMVGSADELLKLMAKGSKSRMVGATLMNADSSRSHSIFTVRVERAEAGPTGKDLIRVGKLNLVDLAGSERQAKTGATGARLKEATKINLSLSALGNVISALVDGKAKHIPYRDSKLTRLLQDSLGGNTKTLMVACISPADNNYDETLSTLRYANRAKNIKNKAVVNEDPRDALLREYQEEIKKLKEMLMGNLPPPAAPGPAAGGAASGQGVVTREVVEKMIPATATQAELLATFKKEKERDLRAVEQRLKTEYDSQLADLERLYSDQKVSNEKLEQEFERLTLQFEGKRADAKAEFKTSLQQKVKDSELARANGGGGGGGATAGKPVAPVVERPAVVVGPDGTVMQALVGFDGTMFKAQINDRGFLEPVCTNGQFEVIRAADGQAPAEVVAKEKPVAVVGPAGTPVVAVRDAEGNAVEARVDDAGILRPVLDAQGRAHPIAGPDGRPAVALAAPEEAKPPKPIAVIGADGTAVPAIVDAHGVSVRVAVDAKGNLVPELDAGGAAQPVLGPDGRAAKPVKAIAEPVTVVSADGVPVIAVEGPDGAPVAARLSKDGRLRAAKNKKGEVEPVLGADGRPAATAALAPRLIPHAVLGASGQPVLAVRDPASGRMVEAVVGPDGQLAVAFDARGEALPIVNSAGEEPAELEAAAPTVAVAGAAGEPVVAVVNRAGQAVRVHIDASGQALEPDRGAGGEEVLIAGGDGDDGTHIEFVTLPQRDAEPEPPRFATMRAPSLRTFEESFEAPAIVPATDAEKAALAALQEKLTALQSQLVGGAGVEEGEREAIKEDLEQRRQRARDVERERLRKAAEAAEDDGILEEIYDNLNDEIAAKNKMLVKAREKNEASQQEIEDLQHEFEQERQQLLEAIRTQEQQLVLQEQLLDTVVPLLRRDCNYTNIDRIKAAAEWDDNLGRWRLPKVKLRDSGSLLQDEGGRGSADSGSPSPSPRPSRLRSIGDDRALERLQRDSAGGADYFASKRASQLAGSTSQRGNEMLQESGKLYRFQGDGRGPQLNRPSRNRRQVRGSAASSSSSSQQW